MDIGDEQIYRARTYSPSERVRVLGIEKRKQSIRVDVEFLDAPHAGRRENIPGSRLHGPWSSVAAFDERWANWQRLDSEGLDDAEHGAVLMVLIALVPEEIGIYDDSPARHGFTVRDPGALEKLMQRPMSDVLDQVDWFDCNGEIELSAAGTLLVAEYVCAANPVVMLEAVMSEEAEKREHCKRGHEFDGFDGRGKQHSSPEREFYMYTKYFRPKHELVRAWCGHRSVTFVERLTAAEAENRRLDILMATGDDEEFRTQVGAEAGHGLNDPGVRVIAEALGDRLVEVLDLSVQVKQLGRDPLHQSSRTGFTGQRQ